MWKISDVQNRLGVTEGTVRQMIRDGRLKAIRVGTRIRIDPAEVESYIKRSTEAAEEKYDDPRLLSESGVYGIRNKRTKALYIGAAHRLFSEAWAQCIERLEIGRHPNQTLQFAWIEEGGRDGFEFFVIERREQFTGRATTNSRVNYWINHYGRYTHDIYNGNSH